MTTILHVIDSIEPGGAETVFVQLADQMRIQGFRSVTVVNGEGWAAAELRRRGLTPLILPAGGSFNWRLVLNLVKLIRVEKVGLIQSHLLGSNVYCAIAALLTGTPAVGTFHGMVDVSSVERHLWLKRTAMRFGLRQYVAVSKALLSELDKRGVLESGKATVIYNGIDVSRYGRSAGSSLRQRLGLDSKTALVGALGNLHPAKGYEYLVDAAARVTSTGVDAHFVVAGNINQQVYSALQRRLIDAGCANHVTFIGFVNDAADFLSQLDVFVLASISEGLSIATLEAMATGLPSVVTRCGGPEEIVNAGKDALVVDPSDSEQLARAILLLLEDSAKAEQLGRAATKSVSSRFSVEEMVRGYVSLYSRLLGGSSAKKGRSPV